LEKINHKNPQNKWKDHPKESKLIPTENAVLHTYTTVNFENASFGFLTYEYLLEFVMLNFENNTLYG